MAVAKKTAAGTAAMSATIPGMAVKKVMPVKAGPTAVTAMALGKAAAMDMEQVKEIIRAKRPMSVISDGLMKAPTGNYIHMIMIDGKMIPIDKYVPIATDSHTAAEILLRRFAEL